MASDSVFHTFANAVASGQFGIDRNAFARGWQMGMGKRGQDLQEQNMQQEGQQFEQVMGMKSDQFKQTLPIKAAQAGASLQNAQNGAARLDPAFRELDYKRDLAIKGTPSGDPRIAGAAQQNPDIFSQNPEQLAKWRNQGEYDRRFAAEGGAQDARLGAKATAQSQGLEQSPDSKVALQLLGQSDKISLTDPNDLRAKYNDMIEGLQRTNPAKANQLLKELHDASGGGATSPGGGGMGPQQGQGGGADPQAWKNPDQILGVGIQAQMDKLLQQGMSPDQAADVIAEQMLRGQ